MERSTQEGREMETTKRAKDMVAGDMVIEKDGALLTVAAVEHNTRWIGLTFERYGVGAAPRCTVKPTARVRVFAD
jgi:hypothetical protein